MNKKLINKLIYGAIILYGIVLIAVMTGVGNLYGSKVDWISQHSVFPDMFRRSFYETKQLIPTFFYEAGGGQNAFHFAYYGFLSPVILLSYLLPFVDMTYYVMGASMVLYLATGVLTYVFLKGHFKKVSALAGAIIILSMAPLTYHFHHHIMFVWYLPFLILALIGVDRFFEKKKPLLFIVSALCIILTNYYFSIGCLVCLFVYAVYRLMEEDAEKGTFLKRFFRCVYIFAIPVMATAFFLFPTAIALVTNSRSFGVTESLENLFLPNLDDTFYYTYSMGITGTMLVAAIGNLTAKGVKKSEIFFNGFLLFITVCPVFTYLLNGTLYVRGKVLIPFGILFIYTLCRFIDNLLEKKLRPIPLSIVTAVALVFYWFSCENNYVACIGIAAALLAALLLKKRPEFIYIFTAVVLVLFSYGSKENESPVTSEVLESLESDEIEELMTHAEEDWFRTNVSYKESDNANRIYSENFNSSSIYSSTSNSLYQDFYETYMGNNEAYRNCFITSGARNELFYTFMGTRYIISDSDPGFAYEKVASGDTLTLYKNTSAFPIAYKSGATISEEEFDKSSFPYSAELLLNYTVVEGGDKPDFETAIIECDVEESYSFEKESSETYEIELSEEYLGKIMYLTFEIDNEGDNANRKDLTICINDVQNKLTAYTWQYYNGNTRFDFVVPLEESTTLTVYVSKGLFEIKDLHMYISDPLTVAEHTEADELELRSFSGKVSCQVSGKEGEYLVTSIPNDKGFSATVNGEKTEIVTVNKAFVGIPLSEGENSIVISYTPPFFVPGVAVSIVGLALALYEILKERFRKNEN